MVKYKENSENNIVEICVDSKITKTDFEQISTQLKASIQKHGKLRLLEEVHRYHYTESIMLLKDILFGLSPTSDFTHAALVTDAKWIPTYLKAINNVLSTKVKAFESAEIDEARLWLTNS